MLTPLRSIGNSRGILLPASFLNSCNMHDVVDIQLKGNQIVLSPAPQAKVPRQGWFTQTNTAPSQAAQLEAAQWDALDNSANPKDDSEWVW